MRKTVEIVAAAFSLKHPVRPEDVFASGFVAK
jgi:hypothetical protein